MVQIPPTRLSLLVRLRDTENHEAWGDFVKLYAPVIYRYARRNRLQDADAADLTQEVLRSVAGAIDRLEYDPGRGLFRSWLFTLAHHRLHDFLVRRQRQEQASGDTAMQEMLNEQPDLAEEARWHQDVEKEMFRWAAEQVRPTVSEATWQAFWQTAVEGKSGQEVAAALGITAAAVYLAKSRVMIRLKEELSEIQG